VNQDENSAEHLPHPELVSDEWRHAMIPWKEGGRLYTYLLPPGVEAQPGWMAMVEGPKGQPFCFPIASIEPHTPTQFQCKPICNVYHPDDWHLMCEAAGAAQGVPTAKPEISMNEDYPKWKAEAADMYVEGR